MQSSGPSQLISTSVDTGQLPIWLQPSWVCGFVPVSRQQISPGAQVIASHGTSAVGPMPPPPMPAMPPTPPPVVELVAPPPPVAPPTPPCPPVLDVGPSPALPPGPAAVVVVGPPST